MRKIFIYISILGLVMGSCYPNGPEYYEETDLVFTKYEEEYDFSVKGTYTMPDRIVKITGDLGEGNDPEFVKEPYNTQIIQMIASNMSDLGWARVDDPNEADLSLLPASWTNTTIYYWYDYWCWYYPYYCGWGWGWGYPQVSSYTTGTLVMILMDNHEPAIEPWNVWTGAVNGLLSGSYNTSRIRNGIDQAFEQSPYLKIK